MSDSHVHLTRVAAARWRLALLLTTAMTVVYAGFILLIVFAWILIMIYVRWTNTHYDHRVADERRARRDAR